MIGKILVTGGTGAMGVYLIPELLARGFIVDVTSRNKHSSGSKNLKYINGNVHDLEFFKEVIGTRKYDAIVDFMNYSTDEFRERYNLILKNCKHYIFLSSYRVFAEAKVITETSPRLLDVSTDVEYLKTDDYALAKARQEDILLDSENKNWTIVRPAITYSSARFQLGTLEADTLVWRAIHDLPVVLPREMLLKTTTMTWAGDVARLIAKLVLDKNVFGEDYNLATNEHHTWAEVAEIYRDVLGLKIKYVSTEDYIEAVGGGFHNYQVKYDRMYNRVLDNTKILHTTGEKQKNFTKLRDGLKRELRKFMQNPQFPEIDYAKQARFDKLTHTKVDLTTASAEEKRVYNELRSPGITKLKQTSRLRTQILNQILRIKHTVRPRTRVINQLRHVKRVIRPRTRIKRSSRRVSAWINRQRYKSADGAILTLTGYYNYGNIIQRFALQEFLRQKNYKFISLWGEPFHQNGTEFDRFRETAKFVKRRIWLKKFEPSDDFPVYIVGSDQVWRNWGYADEMKELGYYFLNFVQNPQVKRIAYAASFGQDNTRDAMISPQFITTTISLVNKFDAISVRESSGVKIMRETWKVGADLVLDPTMLLTADDYKKLIRKSRHKLRPTKPIFTYIIGATEKKTMIIDKIARSTGMEVDNLYLYHFEVLPPVEQWLKGYSDAELVVTDSFHGMAFSIINNTPFVVIENSSGGVARITSLLEQFGLEGRLVSEDAVDTFELTRLTPIDWQKVNKKIDKLRKESAEWLLDALAKPKA